MKTAVATVAILAACSSPLLMAHGQETQPTTMPAAPVEELPEEVLARLSTIEDFTYGFAHPGYYALLSFVKRAPLAPGFAREPLVVADWRVLLDRPADFRGLPITIEGVIGRNKEPYTHTRYPQLGQVWQVELQRHDQPLACTVIFTGAVSDLPLRATIRVTGYFVKTRYFKTRSGKQELAALLVAPGPTQVSHPAPPPDTRQGPDWLWMTVALIVALLVTIVVLRRSSAPARRDVTRLRSRHAAPMHLADDLADWVDREPPDAEPRA